MIIMTVTMKMRILPNLHPIRTGMMEGEERSSTAVGFGECLEKLKIWDFGFWEMI